MSGRGMITEEELVAMYGTEVPSWVIALMARCLANANDGTNTDAQRESMRQQARRIRLASGLPEFPTI